MKRIAFVVSWFYKTFTPTTILVAIFHICTCDDITLVNEKSIVSWKYIKSNKKCVFNVNFQYNHKPVLTAYFSMMFNIHKHISHLIFVLASVIDRNRNRSFNLIQNKVGYRSCFATEVKLEQFLWKVLTLNRKVKFRMWFTADLIVHRRFFF